MKLIHKLTMVFMVIGYIYSGKAAGQTQAEESAAKQDTVSQGQLQHNADPNLIKRLDGIINSAWFSNNRIPVNSANPGNYTLAGQYNYSPMANLSIRGKNTLGNLANNQPLLVVDGVPAAYSAENINPMDVEHIVILKDASAVSIYGHRGANGVIMVTTKRSAYGQPLRISLHAGVINSEKPDAFYRKTMSTAELIEAQTYYFNASGTTIGAANTIQPQPFYSPIAELLNQQKLNPVLTAATTSQLEALKQNDIRNDYNKYLFRSPLTQSYWLNVGGGSKVLSHYFSAGYDNLMGNTVKAEGDRLSITYNTLVKPVKKLDIKAGINFTQRSSKNQAPEDAVTGSINGPFYLYSQLTDDTDSPASIPYKYRTAFKDLMATTFMNNISDLTYIPLQNMDMGYTNARTRNLNVNLNAVYQLSGVFSAKVLYNYNREKGTQDILNKKNSFYTRDLVTQYTAPANFSDPLFGSQPYLKQIPVGGTYRTSINTMDYSLLQGELNADRSWGKNEFHAVAGMEISNRDILLQNDQYYGYDDKTLAINFSVNYFGLITPLFLSTTGEGFYKIPKSTGSSNYQERTAGAYSSAAYSYNKKYTLSASVRRDQFSPFEHGQTYYSVGAGWNLAGEGFYKMSWLPVLRLRGSFGTAGNAYTSSMYNFYLQRQPDKMQLFDAGFEFCFKNNRVNGSIGYFSKRGTDLYRLGTDPVTGSAYPLAYPTAKVNSQGIELLLNSQNLKAGNLSWTSNLLFSYNETASSENDEQFNIYAYRWAGLDAAGNPRGYLNGQPVAVTNASSFASVTGVANKIGSALPVFFGALRNTLNYGAFSVSVNIQYKLGYYFRRSASELVQYNALFTVDALQGAEYSQRWQVAGDELKTNVPSMVYPGSAERDNFYRNAEINVLKADHVRLQEVNLAYTLGKNWLLKNARVYANISNLGIIWKANKQGLDPEVYDFPMPRTYAFGLSANF